MTDTRGVCARTCGESGEVSVCGVCTLIDVSFDGIHGGSPADWTQADRQCPWGFSG